MSSYNFPVALWVQTFHVPMTVLLRMLIPYGFTVANFPHMPLLEAVGTTLVVPGDDRSGIVSVGLYRKISWCCDR